MKILVSGATGFVGRALCTQLQQQRGFEVRATVRSGNNVSLEPQRSFVVGEVGPDTDWRIPLDGVDVVVHLAARAHVTQDRSNSLDAYRRVNVQGTARIARMAAAQKVKRLIFLSSVKVHGQTSAPLHRDRCAPSRGRLRCVEMGSRANTLQVGNADWSGMGHSAPASGLRTRCTSQLPEPDTAVARGVPLPLRSIDNRRSFLYLGNLIDVIAGCLAHPGVANRHFLLSDGEDLSTPDLVRRLARALEVPPRLLPVPVWMLKLAGKIVGEAAVERLTGSLQIDSSLIRQVLGWKQPYTVDEGIAHTAHWYRSLSQTVEETGIMRP